MINFYPQNQSEVTISLPESTEDLPRCLFPLHRKIDALYLDLPWPSTCNEIGIFTELEGGRGDLRAAAKTVNLINTLSPSLNFDWILRKNRERLPPFSFLDSSTNLCIQSRETDTYAKDSKIGRAHV